MRLESADVIHDFWVPQLARKMDMIPGVTNHIWLQADKPGTYLGACAEYCGAEHAWMRFLVIAEPPAEFEAWASHQAQAARRPRGPEGAWPPVVPGNDLRQLPRHPGVTAIRTSPPI